MVDVRRYHWIGSPPRRFLSPEKRIMATAPKIRVRMKEESPSLVKSENYSEVESYPQLFKNENRIRVSPFSGELFISSYRGQKKVWSNYPDINSAIRATGHILTKYDKKGGSVIISTRKLIKIIQGNIPLFKEGKISVKDLEPMYQEVEKSLIEAGYIKSPLVNKKAIIAQLRKSAKPDIKGRFNPLVSRSRLASAWLKLIKELLVADKVRGKYNHLLGLLMTEEELEKNKIIEAYELMSDVISYSYDGYGDLKSRVDFLKKIRWENLNAGIRVAPYRKGALLSAVILFGFESNQHRVLIEKMIGKGDEQMIKAMADLMPIDKLLFEYGRTSPEYVLNEVKRRVEECLNLLSPIASPQNLH